MQTKTQAFPNSISRRDFRVHQGVKYRCCKRSRVPLCITSFLSEQPETHTRGNMSKKASTAVKGTDTLSVLTLNIWGLWLVSKRRYERVKYVSLV